MIPVLISCDVAFSHVECIKCSSHLTMLSCTLWTLLLCYCRMCSY